jgi:hypothetical protein
MMSTQDRFLFLMFAGSVEATVAQNDIAAWACVGLVLIFVLGIILLALYLLTEGVEGIGRRLYAMLLLLVSALVAGVVIGVPIFRGARTSCQD